MIEPQTREHLSEDYTFRHRWRAIGGTLWLDARSQLMHVGATEFSGVGLVSVELTLADLEPARSARNVQLARSIAVDLTGRYGGGYDCGDCSLADATAYECKWLRAPLSVRLWYMDAAGQAPLFYVAYRQADDPGYNL